MNLTEKELRAIRAFGPAHICNSECSRPGIQVWMSLRKKGIIDGDFPTLTQAGQGMLSLMMGGYTLQPISPDHRKATA